MVRRRFLPAAVGSPLPRRWVGHLRLGVYGGAVADAVMDEHLAGFEPPGPDEPAIVVSETATPAQVVAEVTTGLGGLR